MDFEIYANTPHLLAAFVRRICSPHLLAAFVRRICSPHLFAAVADYTRACLKSPPARSGSAYIDCEPAYTDGLLMLAQYFSSARTRGAVEQRLIQA
jgi:hypothetical protein